LLREERSELGGISFASTFVAALYVTADEEEEVMKPFFSIQSCFSQRLDVMLCEVFFVFGILAGKVCELRGKFWAKVHQNSCYEPFMVSICFDGMKARIEHHLAQNF
jgi:hypothetical protein